ncbi:MAG: ABC transporter permease [Acidobacteria bacterium]|nr:MAG: ABC transporter permease [Acidobacteriota bacterium]
MTRFANTGSLIRLALRRDRLLMTAWTGVFVTMARVSAGGTVGLYPTTESRIAAANTINNARALNALYGRIYDPTSLGAVAMIKMGGLGSVFVALLAIAIITRHTRADEEAGRTELLGSTATGRFAPLAAALATAAITSAIVGAFTAAALILAGLPVDGSVVFGLAWMSVGIAFAAIAAVVAQVTTSGRSTTAISGAILGVVYVVRAMGDVASEAGPRWLVWLSPIGWAQQFRPYAGNRWWVLVVTGGFAIATAGLAFGLAARRDMYTGLIPERPGPEFASPRLRSPAALSWRLNRSALLGWLTGFVLVGALLGNLATTVADFFNNPSARDFFLKLGGEKILVDAYFAVEMSIAALIASAFGIQIIARLRSEETAERADPILATGVSRTRWVMSYLVVALAGSTGLMLISGGAAGVTYGIQKNDLGQVWRILGAAAAHIPAIWVMVGIALAAFGLLPRLTSAGWAVLVGFILLSELGPLLSLDQWVMNISPFAHTPKLPGGTFSVTPLLALGAVALGLALTGLAGARSRDIG